MKGWIEEWRFPLTVATVGFTLLFAQITWLKYELFKAGCESNSTGIETRILCKRTAWSYITPGKPDVHFNGVTLKWLDSADRYVNEKQFEEWKNK